MASTYSSLKFEIIGTGDQSGTWGATTNENIGTAIEQAIAGMATLTSADFTANVATLTLINTNAEQDARALCLVVSPSSLSAAGTINVPAIEKPYIIINNDSYAVTVKVSGQTGVVVPAGKRTVVYNNGTDVADQVNFLTNLALGAALPVASGGTGLATTPANGAIDIGNGTGFTRTTLTAGSNITITNTPGAVTIASTGGGGSAGAVTMPAKYISGRYYMQPGVIQGTFGWTSPFGSPVIFYYPIFVSESITVDRLAATVFSTGTSSFELAIYSTLNGVPDSRLATSGALSGATTGIKTATVSAALTPGVYWLAIGFSTNSIGMSGINGMLNFVSGGDSNLIGLYGTYYYSFSGISMLPLPSSASAYTLYIGGDGSNTVPVVSYRIA